MNLTDDSYKIETLDQLEALLGEVTEASRRKEVLHIHSVYKRWIEAVLATIRSSGLDASPRGDPPGFGVVQDEKTLLLPSAGATTAPTACAISSLICAWRSPSSSPAQGRYCG